jgi:hypothetical protein
MCNNEVSGIVVVSLRKSLDSLKSAREQRTTNHFSEVIFA